MNKHNRFSFIHVLGVLRIRSKILSKRLAVGCTGRRQGRISDDVSVCVWVFVWESESENAYMCITNHILVPERRLFASLLVFSHPPFCPFLLTHHIDSRPSPLLVSTLTFRFFHTVMGTMWYLWESQLREGNLVVTSLE